MRFSLTITGFIAGTAIMTVAPAHAQSLPRSAGTGTQSSPRPGGAVPIPRYPYEGKWEGRLTMKGNDTEASTSIPLMVNFTTVDGAQQLYGGEATLGDGRPSPHLRIGTTVADVLLLAPNAAETPGVARRSAASGAAERSGPAANTSERAGSSGSVEALLLYHSPSRSMVICGLDRRCVTLPAVKWETESRDGRSWVYAAQLVGPDSISGKVTRRERGSTSVVTGTLTLRRRL